MNYIKTVSLLFISIIIITFCSEIGLFWDNVLFVSKIGTFLYENGIFNWIIPAEINPGHPPFLASYLAIGWTIFGKSLVVSHWIMLPFIFGLLWQLHSFVCFFIKDKWLQLAGFILVVADPTLLSQLVLVNPELIQLFFFFLALNAVLRNNQPFIVLGLSFLGIITYRGMFLCLGIFLIDMCVRVFVRKDNFKKIITLKTFIPYILGAVPAVIYLIWRLSSFGWLITHPDSPWEELWHFVTMEEFALNVASLAQRFMDFGRLSILAVIVFGLIKKWKSLDTNKSTLIFISVFSTIGIVLVSLFSTNTIGHRYFIVSYLSFALLSFILIQDFKYMKSIYAGLLISLIAGNFIVYSDRFAQGWDSSLAHIPYWDLRKNTIKYMDNNQISISETASFFPNCTSIDNIELNGDMRSFVIFTGKENYVFYSNVYNLSDNDIEILNENYYVLKSFEKRNVRVELMKKKK
jgi:hypothetical protein